MKKQSKTEKNKENAKMTEEILSGKVKLVDLCDFKTKDYMKCKGIYAEVIEGRIRVAFIKCPKCREYISVYKDELKDNNGRTKNKRCPCGFSKSFRLVDWKKK